jgi:predicted dehydrogenase
VGESGVLRANDALNVERPVKVELWRDGQCVSEDEVSNQMAYALQVDSFSAALAGEAAFPAPGEEGWRNQVILDAAYRSMASSKTETIMAIENTAR